MTLREHVRDHPIAHPQSAQFVGSGLRAEKRRSVLIIVAIVRVRVLGERDEQEQSLFSILPVVHGGQVYNAPPA